MRGLVAGVVVCITLLLITVTICLNCLASSNSVIIYEFGSFRCPHCKPMYEFLHSTYGGKYRVYFCDLSVKECSENLVAIVKLGNIPPYIPFIILINGTVRAILIGQYEDPSLINHLLSLPITSKIPVYMGAKKVAEIPGGNATRDFIKEHLPIPPPAIQNSFSTTSKPNTSSTATSSTRPQGIPAQLLIATAVALVVIAAVVAVLGRRLK